MKVLIAWELGSNWGHLATLLPLALRLRRDGHRVLFAVRGLDGDLSLLAQFGFDYVACPVAVQPLQKWYSQPVHGYADVLARCGFADARTLTQLTTAWQSLLRAVQPDIVVCKYAPLAEFATRSCAVLAIGTGFELPPLSTPMPLYRPSSLQAVSHVHYATETLVLQALQVAAQAHGLLHPTRVGAAFEHVQRVCLSTPALDHFGARAGMDYLGAGENLPSTLRIEQAIPLHWHNHRHPVSFVYLRLGATKMAGFVEAVAAQFGQRRWVIVDPSLTTTEANELSARFPEQVIAVNTALNWVKPQGVTLDSVVCHAGHGTVAQALSQGLRLLMLPQHTEQWLLARRAMLSQPVGTGIAMAHPAAALPSLVQALAQLFALGAPVPPTGASATATHSLVQRIVAAVQMHTAKANTLENSSHHVRPA